MDLTIVVIFGLMLMAGLWFICYLFAKNDANYYKERSDFWYKQHLESHKAFIELLDKLKDNRPDGDEWKDVCGY